MPRAPAAAVADAAVMRHSLARRTHPDMHSALVGVSATSRHLSNYEQLLARQKRCQCVTDQVLVCYRALGTLVRALTRLEQLAQATAPHTF